jgi:cation transport ATPase
MTLVGVTVADDGPTEHVVALAGAVEGRSEHAVARAVARAAADLPGGLRPVEEFRTLPGLGAAGRVDGRAVTVGSPALVAPDRSVLPPAVAAALAACEVDGRTAVLVGIDGRVAGCLSLTDAVKPSAADAVARLRSLGLRCVLLTGDGPGPARRVAGAVGIDEVESGADPAAKVALLRRLQDEGRTVAFVGDGINDGPALSAADLGLAVGTGTDVAIDAADMILVRDALDVVPTAIGLARATLRTIHGNLVWAFAYNVAAIPLAAFGLLNPLLAGASMAASSAFVVWNSARLRRFGRGPTTAGTLPD